MGTTRIVPAGAAAAASPPVSSIALTWVLLVAVLSGLAHLVGLTGAALPVTVASLASQRNYSTVAAFRADAGGRPAAPRARGPGGGRGG